MGVVLILAMTMSLLQALAITMALVFCRGCKRICLLNLSWCLLQRSWQPLLSKTMDSARPGICWVCQVLALYSVKIFVKWHDSWRLPSILLSRRIQEAVCSKVLFHKLSWPCAWSACHNMPDRNVATCRTRMLQHVRAACRNMSEQNVATCHTGMSQYVRAECRNMSERYAEICSVK